VKHLSNALRAVFVGISLATMVAAPAALTGCAFFGVQRAQNFDERATAGYKAVSAIADSTLALFRAGTLTKEEANLALDEAARGSAALDLAVQLRGAGDFSQAETRLAAAIAALEMLKSELGAKQ